MSRKKKQEEESGGNAPWMNTFADLMNLLLCFFVLLFSMSTVDAEKYEAIVTSMVNKIDVFPSGGSAVGEGSFVSSGTDQLFQINDYFAEFEESGNPTDSEITGEDKETGHEGYTDIDANDQDIINQVKQIQAEQQEKITKELYDDIQGVLEKKQLEDLLTVEIDEGNKYVQLSLKGQILFDSGKAEIKKDAVSIVDRIGDLLKRYNKHLIKIEGHTDNVTINNGAYPNNMVLSQYRAYTIWYYLVNKKGLDPETLESSGRAEYDPVASNKTAEGRAKNRRVVIKIYNKEEK